MQGLSNPDAVTCVVKKSLGVSVIVQVLMAIVARCCLHTMYEFTAFMNMWAVESLGVSGGVAAQVSFAIPASPHAMYMQIKCQCPLELKCPRCTLRFTYTISRRPKTR